MLADGLQRRSGPGGARPLMADGIDRRQHARRFDARDRARAAAMARLVRDAKINGGHDCRCRRPSDTNRSSTKRRPRTDDGSAQGTIAPMKIGIGSPKYHSRTATIEETGRGETTEASEKVSRREGPRQP